MTDCSAFTAFRSYTGECNNLAHAEWGAANRTYRELPLLIPSPCLPSAAPLPLARTVDLELLSPGDAADGFCDDAVEACDQYDTEVDNVNEGWMDEAVPDREVTSMVQSFGQFFVHDIAFTRSVHTQCSTPNWWDLPPERRMDFPENDPFFFYPSDFGTAGPPGTRKTTAPPWGVFEPTVKRDTGGGLELGVNHVTTFADLSVVYGSDDTTAATIREDFSTGTGRMKTSTHVVPMQQWPLSSFLDHNVDGDVTLQDFLPTLQEVGLDSECEHPDRVFACGDDRCSDNALLFVWHVIYVREHNRLADELAQAHPSWDGEQLFNHARRLNIAQYQTHVKEWFRRLTGDDEAYVYQGYDDTLDATLFLHTPILVRMHSMVVDELTLMDGCAAGTAGFEEDVGLDGYTEHTLHLAGQQGGPWDSVSLMAFAGSLENIVRGMARTPIGRMDHVVTESLKINMGHSPNVTGLSVPSLTIERARQDHVPTYDEVRQHLLGDSVYDKWRCFCRRRSSDGQSCEKDSVGCFDVVSGAKSPWRQLRWLREHRGNRAVAKKLRSLYKTASTVDAWVGVHSEFREDGEHMGPVGRAMTLELLHQIMHGDRMWFENEDMFSAQEIATFRSYSLRNLLVNNLDDVADFLQADVFQLPRRRREWKPEHCWPSRFPWRHNW